MIELGSNTSREAICLVFEKVNTGGKALDAFELVTAMFAASGFRLRDDWAAREKKLHCHAVLRGVSSIDFLQAISLIETARLRAARLAAGVAEPPPVTANRAALLRLPLNAYQREADRVEKGFERAAKFLRRQYIFRVLDLPYQSQLVPLAAMLAVDPGILEHAGRFERLSRWYWCGVFGELYGGATDTRIARDFTEVPGWASGQETEPATATDAIFRSDRLDSMSSRLSAAYKGVSARLMEEGAQNFRSGQPFDHAVFFDESVDIHHIFPRAWCLRREIRPRVFNSIVNKTPLSAKTNRILGGLAPSIYLERLAKGDAASPPIAPATLDAHLKSHCIEPNLLKSDSFEEFMAARRNALLELITAAMGKPVYRDGRAEGVIEVDEEVEAEIEDAGEEEPEPAEVT